MMFSPQEPPPKPREAPAPTVRAVAPEPPAAVSLAWMEGDFDQLPSTAPAACIQRARSKPPVPKRSGTGNLGWRKQTVAVAVVPTGPSQESRKRADPSPGSVRFRAPFVQRMMQPKFTAASIGLSNFGLRVYAPSRLFSSW